MAPTPEGISSTRTPPAVTALKVGFNDRVPPLQLSVMTLQNIFAVTGMFLFPAVLGTSLHLAPSAVAELYGATFIVTGIGTVINSAFGLRLPVVLGPWAPMLSGLVSAAKLSGLGSAFGSLFVAALIWVVLSIPVGGFSVVGYMGKLFRAPILYGGVILILMTSLTDVTVVNWLGTPGSAGFGKASWIGGGVALIVTFAILACVRGPVRSVAMLCGIAAGVIVYAIIGHVSFARVGTSPWLFDFKPFPFGFAVNPLLVVLFFLLLMTSVSNSLALYNVTAEWSGAELNGRRMAWGILGQSITAVAAALFGSFSSTTYPSNLAIVRASRVGSRWVTVTTGIVMIIGGSILKFDAIFVSIPSTVIAASAVILFGVLAMSAIESLSRVSWDQLNFLVLGPAFMISIGGLFVTTATLAQFPLIVRQLLAQPLLDGPVLLVLLHLLVNHVIRPRLAEEAEPPAENVPVTSGAPEVTA
ncbi:MAG TPA: solute carrier family 23 protein [Trebonia sp.]|jgi:xanthine/uracil permease|nr:solute carrier family 23 protein [Trebonia sp.]